MTLGILKKSNRDMQSAQIWGVFVEKLTACRLILKYLTTYFINRYVQDYITATKIKFSLIFLNL